MKPKLEEEWKDWLYSISNTTYGYLAERMCGYLVHMFGDIPIPAAGWYEDHNLWQFVWDKNEHHIDMDILTDGSYDWFYRNRTTGALDSGENNNVATLGDSKFREYIGLIK